MKRLIKLVGLLIIAIAAVLGSMRMGLWNPSYDDVRAAQATAPSTFEKIGTATLHMRDEGPRDGPAVIMLHSSMTNLREWDGWAEALKDKYRVIRFDWPPYGLSTDTAPSTGMPGVVALLEKVVAAKGLRRFAMVGTSSGATISTLYAARHPEQVTALALSALPLEAPPTTDFSRLMWAMIWTHETLVPNYYPRAYYRQSLSELYGRPERLTDATVDWYYQTNTIPGGFARVKEYWEANKKAVWAKGAAGDAAQVTAPILLQWGDRDPVLPKALATKAVSQFEKAKVDVIHYPDVGHYPMLERPRETAGDLRIWLDRSVQ